MANTATANGKETLAKLNKNPQSSLTRVTDTRPLPNGRPIASNASEGIAALMGYLD